MTPNLHERRGTATTISIGLVASAAVLGLLISGVTFLALAITLELAVPIVRHYNGTISAADIAVAGHMAGYWWVFGGIAVASFVAAAGVAVKVIRHLDRGREPR